MNAERTSNNRASKGRVRVPTDRLGREDRASFNELLRRVLDLIDAQMPSIAQLFHEVEMQSLRAMHESLRAMRCRASGRCNAHVDRQTLTVLIPLSTPESYEGGGTGFWSREARASGRWSDRKSDVPPSVVLRPERGTAILYGGTVPHAGMPVLHGCRAIFLASFSTKRNDLASLEFS